MTTKVKHYLLNALNQVKKTTLWLIIASLGEVRNAWAPQSSQVRFCTMSLKKYLHGILRACSDVLQAEEKFL